MFKADMLMLKFNSRNFFIAIFHIKTAVIEMEALLEFCLGLLNDLANECLRVNLVIKQLPLF